MRRSTGWSSGRTGSRTAWHGGILKTACWCSMMSLPHMLKVAAVRWRATATVATTAMTGHRSSMGFCARLPVAVEVFDGNTADPSTLSAQVAKVKDRFAITRVVLVGDRGMITSARIRDDLKPAGLDWITCLRAPAIKALAGENGPLQLSLFDERDLAEISAPELYPGERLIICRNRDLAAERARKREDLMAATEREIARVQALTPRRNAPLRSAAEIGMAVGAVVDS